VKTITACSALVALLVTATAALPSPFAPTNRRHAIAAGPRVYLTVPRGYYPTVARPPSLYEIYDSLKDKTWCWLPSEPCDNTERIAN
jgi:hypothetical protein